MKASNYLAKLPQEAPSKASRHSETMISLPWISSSAAAPLSHCGSTDCVIKDSGVWQTVRHIPSNHRGTGGYLSQTQALLQRMSLDFL